MAYFSRILTPSTQENVEQDRSKEVTDLEDELALFNVERAQSSKELQSRTEKLEQTIQSLKQMHQNDMTYVISVLLNEMIKDVEDELIGSKCSYESGDFGEEGKQKKSRLI